MIYLPEPGPTPLPVPPPPTPPWPRPSEPKPKFVRLLVALALATLGGCSAPATSCTQGICVQVETSPQAGPIEWPEAVPDHTAERPRPATTDRAGKKNLPTAIPPGWPMNSPRTDDKAQERRVTFVFRRSVATGPPLPLRNGTAPFRVELEWSSTDGQGQVIADYEGAGWRHTVLIPVGSHVQLFVTPDRGRYDWLKCHIEINGNVPSVNSRHPTVPLFRPEGYAEWPHHCYADAWVT